MCLLCGGNHIMPHRNNKRKIEIVDIRLFALRVTTYCLDVHYFKVNLIIYKHAHLVEEYVTI